MTTGFAFTAPASVVKTGPAGGAEKINKIKDGEGKVFSGEKGVHPFHKMLKNEARKAEQNFVSFPSGKPKTPNPDILKKLKDEIQNGVIDVKDLLMFLRQLVQGGVISQKQLKSLLVEKVIPVFEKGGKDLQELAKLLKNAFKSSEKSVTVFKKNVKGLAKNSEDASLAVGKKSGMENVLKLEENSQKDGNERAWAHELVKELKVKESSGKLSDSSNSLPSHNSGKVQDQNLLGKRILKNTLREHVEKDQLKDWINSFDVSESKNRGSGKTPGVDFNSSKIVPIETTSLGQGSRAFMPLTNKTGVHVQNPPIVHQIIQTMDLSQKDGHYIMRIALKPPQLGNIDVSLTVRGHHIQANFSVENPITHEILTHQLPELRALLAQQGLTMREVSVQVGGGNPQGFRPFERSPQEFSGRGKGKETRLRALGEILEDGSENIRRDQIERSSLRTSVERINVIV